MSIDEDNKGKNTYPYLELKYIAVDGDNIIEQPKLNKQLDRIIEPPKLLNVNKISLNSINKDKIVVGRNSFGSPGDILINNFAENQSAKKFISRFQFKLTKVNKIQWMISDEISKSCTKVFRKKNQSELLINIQKKGIQYLEDRDSIRILSHYNQDKQAVYLCFTFMDDPTTVSRIGDGNTHDIALNSQEPRLEYNSHSKALYIVIGIHRHEITLGETQPDRLITYLLNKRLNNKNKINHWCTRKELAEEIYDDSIYEIKDVGDIEKDINVLISKARNKLTLLPDQDNYPEDFLKEFRDKFIEYKSKKYKINATMV